MKITILTDNYPGKYTDAEHGLSYLIEFDGKKILFDTGQSDLFLKNAGKMQTDLSNIDKVILSHGHFDHGDGLQHLKGGTLICHPGCFVKRFRKVDKMYIGLKNTENGLKLKFDLITTIKPYKITDSIVFLGEIPRITEFESKSTSFVFEDESPDFVMDDSAVALLMEGGVFVITGCGHAGIVNTLEHAKSTTGENHIIGIMGGFHLKYADNQTKETIAYLKKNNVKYIYPSHCTELSALIEFYKVFPIKQLKTGDVIEIMPGS